MRHRSVPCTKRSPPGHELVLTGLVDKRVGVARAKRRHLSRTERTHALARARDALTAAGWPADTRISALALTDLTQTFRVRAANRTAVLKLSPSSIAALVLEAEAWLRPRGASLPDVRWHDVDRGSILFEDVGKQAMAHEPHREELGAVAVMLAELHAAGRFEAATAARVLPMLASQGWPTPAAFAARLLTQVSAATPAARGWLMDAASTLAEWIDSQPRLIVGDVKREHIRIREQRPVLTDLELVTAWDVIPSNLATLLSFPGQFQPAVDTSLRRWVLERYAEAHDRLEGTVTDVDRLDRSVTCAAALMEASLTTAEDVEPGAARGVTRRIIPGRPAGMVRVRALSAAAAGLLSIEHELGPDLFGQVRRRLSQPRSLRVLDVGCGDGVALAELTRVWPHHRLVGLDRFPGSWREGRVLGDAQALPVRDGTFHLVWVVQLLQYAPDKLGCIREIQRVLATGGLAVFAMTEHFDDQSAFVPPLMELAARCLPPGTVASIADRRIGERRSLTFAVHKHGPSCVRSAPLVKVVALATDAGDGLPYLQSHYNLPRASSSEDDSR